LDYHLHAADFVLPEDNQIVGRKEHEIQKAQVSEDIIKVRQ